MSTQPVEGNPLLDVAAAAAHLGVSEAFVRRLVLERRIRYFKVGRFVRFRAVDLDAFVEGRATRPGGDTDIRAVNSAPRRTACQRATQDRGSPKRRRRMRASGRDGDTGSRGGWGRRSDLVRWTAAGAGRRSEPSGHVGRRPPQIPVEVA
ncbi:MAG: helix-turn-helix domain-containing protein [Acidimicrobiales bacterium]